MPRMHYRHPKARTKDRCLTIMGKNRWLESATLFLLSIGFLVSSGVDGFVNPSGLASGSSMNSGGTFAKPLGPSQPRVCLHWESFPRPASCLSKRRTNKPRTTAATTSTQLGITVVLPLPLAAPRLSGTLLRIADTWAPTVGVLTSTLLYLAPSKAVWAAIRRARNQSDSEGDDPMYGLNPLPIAILPSVAVSWLVYGLASSDPYLIMGNLPGTILSVAYLIGILPLMNYNAAEFPTLPSIVNDNIILNNIKNNQNTPKQDEDNAPTTNGIRRKPKKSKTLILTQVTVLLSTASTLGFWALLGLMTAGATNGLYNIGGLEFGMGFSSMLRSGVIVRSLGLYAASLFILLSGSPLSTIRTVLRTKNSRTILGPFTAAQCVNTGLWTAYGVAVNDHFVWGPNIIGLGLGLIQLTLKILFPAKKRRTKVERALKFPTTVP